MNCLVFLNPFKSDLQVRFKYRRSKMKHHLIWNFTDSERWWKISQINSISFEQSCKEWKKRMRNIREENSTFHWRMMIPKKKESTFPQQKLIPPSKPILQASHLLLLFPHHQHHLHRQRLLPRQCKFILLKTEKGVIKIAIYLIFPLSFIPSNNKYFTQ